MTKLFRKIRLGVMRPADDSFENLINYVPLKNLEKELSTTTPLAIINHVWEFRPTYTALPACVGLSR